VIYFIQYFRYYLQHRPFTLRTDHRSVMWAKTGEEPASMILRWLEVLANYNFETQHRPRKSHANADALSKIDHAEPEDLNMDDDKIDIMAITALVEGVASWDKDIVLREQRRDPDLKQVLKWVHYNKALGHLEKRGLSGEARVYHGWVSELKLNGEDNLLYRVKEPEDEEGSEGVHDRGGCPNGFGYQTYGGSSSDLDHRTTP
jgi:hypothetical protein